MPVASRRRCCCCDCCHQHRRVIVGRQCWAELETWCGLRLLLLLLVSHALAIARQTAPTPCTRIEEYEEVGREEQSRAGERERGQAKGRGE
jgi:hypothetical protein